jgi:predicted component of type VI protein secretion system
MSVVCHAFVIWHQHLTIVKNSMKIFNREHLAVYPAPYQQVHSDGLTVLKDLQAGMTHDAHQLCTAIVSHVAHQHYTPCSVRI